MGATLILVAVVLSFWLLYRFSQIIFILAVAIIIGTILATPVTWLQQHGIPGVIGVTLVYLLLLASLIGFIFLLAPLIIEQGTTIAGRG
ncbi:MAG: AI-2E family transporter [Chloroflexi bacterium]|nr:AI-2E family transporter [Chloroflexota bacterium]